MKRLVAYIAGPFRARTAWGIEQNIRRAEEVSLMVWRAGAIAVCPHLNTRHFQDELPDEVWADGDLEIMKRCDALVLVDGWESSRGTLAEIMAAECAKIPVFKSVGEFSAFLRSDSVGESGRGDQN